MVDKMFDMQKENRLLRSELKKCEDEKKLLSSHYQHKLEKTDDEIRNLKCALIDADSQIHKAIAMAEINAKKAGIDSHRAEMNLRKDLAAARDEINHLTEFRNQKQKTDTKLHDLEGKNRLLEEEMVASERKSLLDKSRTKREMDSEIEEIQKNAMAIAREEINEQLTNLVEDNKRITGELRFQLDMIEDLEADKCRVEDLVRRLRGEMSVNAEKEKDIAKKSHVHNCTTKRLRDEIELQQVNKLKLEETNIRMISKLERELGKYKKDADELRSIISRKNLELNESKRLARTAHTQRTEVERFLIESLLHVKENMSTHNRLVNIKNVKSDCHQQTRIMEEGTTDSNVPRKRKCVLDEAFSSSNLVEHCKIDVADLTWEDKERVLRLLFTKINNKSACIGTRKKITEALSSGSLDNVNCD